jgi:hypothetical protein
LPSLSQEGASSVVQLRSSSADRDNQIMTAMYLKTQATRILGPLGRELRILGGWQFL